VTWGIVTIGGSVAVLGTGLVLALAVGKSESEPKQGLGAAQIAGLSMFAAGLIGGLAGGMYIMSKDWSRNGHAKEHTLSEYEGRLFAEKYNRAVLRKAIKDVQEGPAASIAPKTPVLKLDAVVSPTFLGVAGTF
jgi:hypothetical protein